jgi:hypothetical protein
LALGTVRFSEPLYCARTVRFSEPLYCARWILPTTHTRADPKGRFIAEELEAAPQRVGERRVWRLCRQQRVWSTPRK